MTIFSSDAQSPPIHPVAAARWQQALKDAVRDPDELCQLLAISDSWAEAARHWARRFPLFVPRGYVARMRPGDPYDPLLRQVLPLAEEQTPVDGFVGDPVGDLRSEVAPGLLQKYRARVLMVTTGACAVHCRYCFRRHYPYSTAPKTARDWRPAVDEIAADRTIEEVILSGGDPLTLVDEQLAEVVDMLQPIGHLRRLRIHTRLPIMIPERVTGELIDWLTGSRLAPVMVIHANHAAELDSHVAAALARLSDAGVLLLNQSVLLRGVNDSIEALEHLSQRLIELRVLPYYLHQLDAVAGAAHFLVPVECGQELIRQLRARLPGFAVPRYVQEIAGADYKVPLA
jgi:EF-P beta-lysylation protein EpmB